MCKQYNRVNLPMFGWVTCEGPGIAPQHTACSIQLPRTVQSLSTLLEYLRTTMGHNFLQALMVMGSCIMALHYNTILSKFLFRPIPLAFGEPGTGKTTALRCGLAITEAHPARFYSKGTFGEVHTTVHRQLSSTWNQ